ncbi:MAG: hypothetical protein QOE66_3277 [Chloroflexota bacterium]|jgi:hypothetical protein|nr:hypothetical protein [Chloroflexota bacterium]
MSAVLRDYLWIGVIVAIGIGIVAAIWLAGLAGGTPPPAPPNVG